MIMKNYLIYTVVTTWNEPPRARHQVTNELKQEGKVYFVERNRVGRPRIELTQVEENVVIVTPYFPVLYKVRYRTPGLNELYHNWLLKKIKEMKLDFEMVISFDYTAPAINRYFDNVVFFCADDNVGFGNFNPSFINRYHTKTEKLVAEKAKACIVTSDYMGWKIGNYNKNTHVVPLGAPRIENIVIAPPEKKAAVPTLAIVAFFDKSFDMELICELAEKFPIILIGPMDEGRKKILSRYPNAELVGPKTGKDLYQCLSRADVCIAPYNLRTINKGLTPNKLWLYLALGKPCVVTDVPNIKSWHFEDKLVYKCKPEEFINCCMQAYKDDNYELAVRRIEVAKNNTWKTRVDKLKEIFYSSRELSNQALQAQTA
jgi:glycosyltransferase involved in cell wall biosynthesis